MPSIIIPAHNEATVIGRCLKSIESSAVENSWEVIVVCNGCADDTANLARSYDFTTVIEISESSKIAALNVGDDAAESYPRVYLDADVLIEGHSLSKCIESMSVIEQVAAPVASFDLKGCSLPVKLFYKFWTRLPYFKSGGMVGSGIYIINQEGRKKFGRFPKVIADDGYVRRLFKPSQRMVFESESFRIFPPKKLASLINIKTRSRLGNVELDMKYPEFSSEKDNSMRDILSVAFSSMSMTIPSLVYIFVQIVTKIRVNKRIKDSDFITWNRDDSSRIKPIDMKN